MFRARRLSRPQRAWAHSNFGILQGIASTRRDAIKECEALTGEPWSKCRAYMEVWKCIVTPEPPHDH